MSYKPVQSSGEDFLQDYLGNIGLPIELTSQEIERVENGVVTATLTQYNKRAEAGGACNGEFRMRGTYRDNKLTLGGRNGGASGKCGLRFEAVKEGNNITGET